MYKITRLHVYLTILVAFWVHMTLIKYISIFGVRPDILLICVVFFGLFTEYSLGFEAGMLAGLLKDTFSLDYFGINTFILGSVGFLAGIMHTKLFRESKSTQFLLVLLFAIFSMALHFGIVYIFSKNLYLGFAEYFGGSVVPVSLYTSLVSLPVFSKFIKAYDIKELEDLL